MFEVNELSELTAIFPGDGRYWKSTKGLSAYLSEAALIATRIEVEARYLCELSLVGAIRPLTYPEHLFLDQIKDKISIDNIARVKAIEEITNHDVKAVEKFFAEFLAGTTMEDLVCHVHTLLTSEDINNLSYRIMYRRALENVYLPTLRELIDTLALKAECWGGITLLGRTHGQAAIPTTIGKEIVNFAVRLNREYWKLSKYQMKGKLNGAIGNYNSFYIAYPDIDWLDFSRKFVIRWNFDIDYFTTQINPFDDLVESFQILQRINSIMIGFNQDMWRYISDDIFIQIKKAGEIGSSVMTQKINPISFENGEGNYKMANGIWDVLCRELPISRLQRDLVNSTEVRNIGVGLSYGLLAIKSSLRGIGRILPNLEKISADLNKNWNILGEPVQSVLRTEGLVNAYSLVEEFTKGVDLDANGYLAKIAQLPISEEAKNRLLELTPDKYIGKANILLRMALKEIRSER